MMDMEWFSSDSFLLSAWMGALFFAFIFSVGILFFSKIPEKLQRFFFLFLIFPNLVVGLVFSLRGFESSDRPVFHWVYQKDVRDSLHLGFVLDPMAVVTTVVFGVVLLAISLRNRPRIQVISAMSLSWVSLAIAVSSKTFWTTAMAIGVGMIARFLPILFNALSAKPNHEPLDELWMISSKRSWIGLLVTLTGAAGLTSNGIHLDFFSDGSWKELLSSTRNALAASLFLMGLLIQFIPAITSTALHRGWLGHFEEENFIFETAGGWTSVLIFYRILPSLRDTPWAYGVEIVSLSFLSLSLLSLAFVESKRGAINFWLSNLPLLVLTILPSFSGQAAFLYVTGSIVTFNGLLLCLDHTRSRIDLGLAVFFFLGVFGFMGWSTSFGIVEYVSQAEAQPILCSLMVLVWLLFAAFGFRIILRGGDSEGTSANPPKWITAGFLILLGFGPVLSGRWGAGAIPEVVDWIDGAKDWPWVHPFLADPISINWFGFGVTQSLILLAILLGTFVSPAALLFPFAGRYPRGLVAARGLFGGVWLHHKGKDFLSGAGEIWVEKISGNLWDNFLPKAFEFVFQKLRHLGEFLEEQLDLLTSPHYACLFRAPSKFVQWFHGGNVRLYAWFALIWILIISVYLTR